jgi:hypothetical protein
MSFKESVYQMHSAFKRFHYGSHLEHLRHECIRQLQHCAFAPQPNCGFNADANISHAFGIFMAYVGALQPSASGAG